LKHTLYIILFCLFGTTHLAGQSLTTDFFSPSDTFSQKRFNAALGFTIGTYATFSTGLYLAWYSKNEQSGFHFFDDRGEWMEMDKGGHIYSSYFQAQVCYRGAKWTGLSEKKSILTGIVCASLFQTTIEVMDGFSDKWGFSISDMVANGIGVSAFAVQQHLWKEQRITLKVSGIATLYDDFNITGSNGTVISTRDRRDDLYGKTYLETYLKDYNTQAYWASVNVHSFLPEGNKWPKWLNVALGYGAQNMYGGYSNTWEQNGETFTVDADLYPRVRQYYLGLDLDIRNIKTKSKFWNTILEALSVFKLPGPALEINSRGQLTFHILR